VGNKPLKKIVIFEHGTILHATCKSSHSCASWPIHLFVLQLTYVGQRDCILPPVLIFLAEQSEFNTELNITSTTHNTHTQPFYGPLGFCPGPPSWASTRKEKLGRQNQSGFTGARDSWVICKSAPWPRHITMPTSHHSIFYRPVALPADQPTASKHWRQELNTCMAYTHSLPHFLSFQFNCKQGCCPWVLASRPLLSSFGLAYITAFNYSAILWSRAKAVFSSRWQKQTGRDETVHKETFNLSKCPNNSIKPLKAT